MDTLSRLPFVHVPSLFMCNSENKVMHVIIAIIAAVVLIVILTVTMIMCSEHVERSINHVILE